ncbi:uncharacterized protein METZ01_LOCUS148469 [marine metagenome]|uniref:Uncharacterized protein n=1 Tax=marine metagenome TaxID=408172 RepID=A0A382A255_9ZZZZ
MEQFPRRVLTYLPPCVYAVGTQHVVNTNYVVEFSIT